MRAWAILPVLLSLSPFAAGCEINLTSEMQTLQQRKGQEVVRRLWDSGTCEVTLLRNIASAKPEWIEFAVAVRPYTDAWSGESLIDALAQAMQVAPTRVLPLLGKPGFDEGVCVPWGFDDSPQGEKRAARVARKAAAMFRTFLGTAFAPKAQVCLESIPKKFQ